MLQWQFDGRSVAVSPEDLAGIETEKFKSRAALLTFSRTRPGALAAHFLSTARVRMKGASGVVTRSRHLRDITLAEWVANGCSGVTETRDLREMQTLAAVADALNQRNEAHAMDTIVMRMLAMGKAKEKGGSWDKASRLELIPLQGGDQLPAGLASLTS